MSILRRLWSFLRAVTGDSAYETFLRRTSGGPPPTRQEFFCERLARRYEGPNRCC
ncbi:MAG TPA: YbdD/YjiX family protein [Vicinamibacteria bacterium]